MHFKISKNFACELDFLTFPRSIKDSLEFFSVTNRIDYYKSDHKPAYEFEVSILNVSLIYLEVYNINHVEDDINDFTVCLSKEKIEDLRIKVHSDYRYGVDPDKCVEPCTSFDDGIDVAFDSLYDDLEKEYGRCVQ